MTLRFSKKHYPVNKVPSIWHENKLLPLTAICTRISEITRECLTTYAVQLITDSAGNNIIQYEHDGGWIAIFTPEEDARAKLLYQIYNDEWKQAKSEITAFEQKPFDLGVGTYSKLAWMV